jgi:hypothetical protein
MKPTALGHSMGNRVVLSLSTGTGHRRLALGGPRDQVFAEEDTIAGCRAPGVRTARPIRVRAVRESTSPELRWRLVDRVPFT